MAVEMSKDLDTSQIRNWRSIITLVIFVLTNIIVLFPFNVPVYIPRPLSDAVIFILRAGRVIPPKQDPYHHGSRPGEKSEVKSFVQLTLPMNYVTAPLIADLFLLAISAIGRKEVYDGTIGADNISPFDIILVFLSLGYIANSLEASGLVKFLVFKVLRKGGSVGHRLYAYLYPCFFGLGIFIGNDPIMVLFLSYMNRIATNIIHPRAWIHTQFAVANIATAILVTSNPTNLVLAGAFNIKFVIYTANMIVPVVSTAILLFPFLLYFLFADQALIPLSIQLHEITDEARWKKPRNSNIPDARIGSKELENEENIDDSRIRLIEEVLHPFLDKGSAVFGAFIMVSTIIILLALNDAYLTSGGHSDYWVALPSASVMLSWDLTFGWLHRHETREIVRKERNEVEQARLERLYVRDLEEAHQVSLWVDLQDCIPISRTASTTAQFRSQSSNRQTTDIDEITPVVRRSSLSVPPMRMLNSVREPPKAVLQEPDKIESEGANEKTEVGQTDSQRFSQGWSAIGKSESNEEKRDLDTQRITRETLYQSTNERPTLTSLIGNVYKWSQETFPTATAAVGELPFALVPFAFSMFVLVQALVHKGWVPIFARGWDHWVNKTGTVGSISGMGFLAVILCNFAGTNIGASILLSRVVQAWQEIHEENGIPISDRTFWATVYSMALGVNYGAFSLSFSASLAGIMWRDVLAKQGIRVRRLDFTRVNLPIIAFAMTISCVILVGELHIVLDNSPYNL